MTYRAQRHGARLEHKDAAVSNSSSAENEVPSLCTCFLLPYPHQHSLIQRQAAVQRWNRESKNKLPVPRE